jgi:hypothetical protein
MILPSFQNPNGISSFSPRLRGTSYLGDGHETNLTTLKELHPGPAKIPTGFHHSAQGCEERATLGYPTNRGQRHIIRVATKSGRLNCRTPGRFATDCALDGAPAFGVRQFGKFGLALLPGAFTRKSACKHKRHTSPVADGKSGLVQQTAYLLAALRSAAIHPLRLGSLE